MRNKVRWAGWQLPVFLDALVHELPLHWREIVFSVQQEQDQSQAHVYICTEGHVHCSVGMEVPKGLNIMAGLFAYTIAVAFDGEAADHDITRERFRDVCKLVRAAVAKVDQGVAGGYARSIGFLREWFDAGSKERTLVLESAGYAEAAFSILDETGNDAQVPEGQRTTEPAPEPEEDEGIGFAFPVGMFGRLPDGEA